MVELQIFCNREASEQRARSAAEDELHDPGPAFGQAETKG